MFTKKTKIVVGTAALTIVAFAVTGVASARVGVSRLESRTAAWSEATPMHDGHGPRDGRGPRHGRRHLDAAATALGVTPDALKQLLADGSTLADVATAKGVAVQKVIDAIVADVKTEIAQAVADGKLTKTEADAMLANVVEHVTAIVNGERPARGFGHGPRDGRDGRGPGHLDAAATALGVTPDALKQLLADGSTLADVATAKGVAVQKVIDAIVADVKTEIAQAVADGKLTKAKADAMLANVVEHVTAIVNGERPARGFGHGPRDGRDGHGRHGHPHGDRSTDGPRADQSSDA